MVKYPMYLYENIKIFVISRKQKMYSIINQTNEKYINVHPKQLKYSSKEKSLTKNPSNIGMEPMHKKIVESTKDMVKLLKKLKNTKFIMKYVSL